MSITRYVGFCCFGYISTSKNYIEAFTPDFDKARMYTTPGYVKTSFRHAVKTKALKEVARLTFRVLTVTIEEPEL